METPPSGARLVWVEAHEVHNVLILVLLMFQQLVVDTKLIYLVVAPVLHNDYTVPFEFHCILWRY